MSMDDYWTKQDEYEMSEWYSHAHAEAYGESCSTTGDYWEASWHY